MKRVKEIAFCLTCPFYHVKYYHTKGYTFLQIQYFRSYSNLFAKISFFSSTDENIINFNNVFDHGRKYYFNGEIHYNDA